MEEQINTNYHKTYRDLSKLILEAGRRHDYFKKTIEYKKVPPVNYVRLIERSMGSFKTGDSVWFFDVGAKQWHKGTVLRTQGWKIEVKYLDHSFIFRWDSDNIWPVKDPGQ